MKTVLIADDHEIVRRGVRMIIESISPEYQFIEAATCAEVIQKLSDEKIDYAVLDMFLTDGNIFSCIQQITASSQHTNILIYSMNAERVYARRFIEKGVRGFVCKQNPIEELEKAIRTVLNGEIYLSQELKESLFGAAAADQPGNPIDLLSDRELEVTEYVAMGMGSKEIAQKMNLDITTVSTYRRRAFEKLNVENMIELKEKFLLYKG